MNVRYFLILFKNGIALYPNMMFWDTVHNHAQSPFQVFFFSQGKMGEFAFQVYSHLATSQLSSPPPLPGREFSQGFLT